MRKYITRIIFALLAAAIVILPLLPGVEPAEPYTYAEEMDFRMSYAEEPVLCLFNRAGIIAELPADSHDGYYLDFSLKRESAFVIPDMDFDTGGTLYHVGTEATRIDDGVYHVFASDSSCGAYITELEAGRSRGRLNYYDGSTSICIEEQICTRLNNGRGIGVAISPDGKTVAYCRAEEDGGITGMLYHKGKYIELGADIFPIAVSDKMKYLYYGQLTMPASEIAADAPQPVSAYYVRSGGEDVLLGESRGRHFRFNCDFSEAIITTNDFNAICIDGGRELQYFNDFYPVGVIAPQAGLAAEIYAGDSLLLTNEYVRVGVDSFRGKVLHGVRDSGGLSHDVCLGSDCSYHNTAYLDEELQLYLLTEWTHNLQIAEAGHAALYKQGESLYLIPDVRSHAPGEEQLISSYCKKFSGNADFSAIYYVNTGNDLYSWRNGSRTLLAEDVELLTPAGGPGTALYRNGVVPVRFNGDIYFRRKDDGSMWRIGSDETIAQVEGIPDGAQPYAFGDELLFRVDTPEGQVYYRFEAGRIVKAFEGIRPYR